MKKYIEQKTVFFLIAAQIASFVMSVPVPMLFEDFLDKIGVESVWLSLIFAFFVMTILILIDYISFVKKEKEIEKEGIQRIKSIMSTNKIEELKVYATSSAYCQSTLNSMGNIKIKNCTLMIRNCGSSETERYREEVEGTIEKWKEMRRDGRIVRLRIIEYDHIPDSYFILADNLFAAVGVLDFDEKDSTGQYGDRNPYCIFNDSKENMRIIGLYNRHFDNYEKKYGNKIVYDSDRH